jgi:hypothetical protein
MKKTKFKYRVCKPCWELKYCPFGSMVEHYPAIGDAIDMGDVTKRYNDIIARFIGGELKSEEDILDAIDMLEFHWPPRWQEMNKYDYSDLQCKQFGHICPVFFNAEMFTETKEKRKTNRSRYIAREIMLKVVRRDGQICQICKKNVLDKELHFDHIIPVSKGGPTSVENLRVLCEDCNRGKGDSIEEITDG